MPKPKRLLLAMEVDVAKRATRCRRDASHTIPKGSHRLKIRQGRNTLHYCEECALLFVEHAKEQLKVVELEFAIAREKERLVSLGETEGL